jgi:diguanylate cyclase (GGDEF)-like protein/PAS domain S-box-containing protein
MIIGEELFHWILWPIIGSAGFLLYAGRKNTPKPQTVAAEDSPDAPEAEKLRRRNALLELGAEIEKLYALDLPPETLQHSVFEQIGKFKHFSTVWAGLKGEDGHVDAVYVHDETELGFLTQEYSVRYVADGSEARNPSEYAFASGKAHLFSQATDAPMNRECLKRLQYAPLVSVISVPLFYSDSKRPDGVMTLYTDTVYDDEDGVVEYLQGLMQRFMRYIKRYETYHRFITRFDGLKTSRAFYENMIETLPIRFYWKNRDLVYLGSNALFAKDARLSGPDALKGKTDRDLFGPETADALEAGDKKVIEQGTELINRLEKQGDMWRLSNRAPLRDGNGQIIGLVVAYSDYTLLQRVQHYHETNEQRFRALLDQMPTIAVQGFDAERRINYWNRQSERLFGYSAQEAKGRKIDELMLPETQRKRFAAGVANWLLHNESLPPQEHTVIAKSGRAIPVHSARILLDRTAESPQFYAIDIDLSLQKAAESKLKQLADYDALTMLPNRHQLNHHLGNLILKAKREQGRFAIFFIDLDNFKYINDTFGHNYGDELLIKASERLKSVLREYDFIARFGGDEFIVTVEYGADRFVTSQIARKMIDVLQREFIVKEKELYISASIGISLFPDNSSSLDILLKQADTAMYKAKKNGKNQFAYYSEELSADIESQLIMESALRQTFYDDKLMFFYQPQIDLETNEIVSCEALVRWYDEASGNYIPPETFLPIVEKAHLMKTLTKKAFEDALTLLDQWRAMELRLIRIDINLPAEALNSEELLHFVGTLLERFDIEAKYIGIEITETRLVDLHTEKAKDVLRAFSEMGLHISIDDFGTGYSSLSYLSCLTIDTVKIDKGFVMEHEHKQNQALIRSIIAMSHELGYQVIAEGVETAEQAALLRDHHCDKVQGNYFYPPLYSEAITQKLFLEKRQKS